ncbi:phage minor capsid protein [Pseudoflavonifractor phocaeensis]|uniref:phage minor capsid protein n=1 Tax=Pseudoflavonifractor phocaeensis TaxID=1870988 RepID=UPI001958AD70|nr:phage minor capsid protein [Pseudoflavonifractor phocaeensis]MBM6887181.1 minor capsid protein [Pseudoflavonifractor phocaeensis]
MPTLQRAPNGKELEKLISIYLKAETDIINEIGRLRSRGLVDYHAVAALERVQTILRKLENDAWEYVPKMIEKQFYVRVPEARKALEVPETAAKHAAGYMNAAALTGEQMNLVQMLTQQLMGEITDAAMTAMATIQSAILGRVEPDVYRRVGLEQVAAMQATGKGVNAAVPGFVEALRREGITAFVDKAGRRWSLHTYCSMVTRTTSRQAEIAAVLSADPEQDLYKISSHGTTCAICAPYEGRVYSRSGTDPDFPALADAFGKIDPNGPANLANTYLNIHPNCLHVLLPWTTAGRTPEEIQKIKDFSNPQKNPYSVDPRSQKQIEAYRKKETARRHWLERYRQWERYRMTLGDKVPKTYQTFERHKLANDDKYREWERLYREANAQ